MPLMKRETRARQNFFASERWLPRFAALGGSESGHMLNDLSSLRRVVPFDSARCRYRDYDVMITLTLSAVIGWRRPTVGSPYGRYLPRQLHAASSDDATRRNVSDGAIVPASRTVVRTVLSLMPRVWARVSYADQIALKAANFSIGCESVPKWAV